MVAPVSGPQQSAGDPLPENCRLIEVHVSELKQLFNALDPSPFREKDLDPAAEEFIVGWARELPRDVPLALAVYLDRAAGLPEEPATLRDAIGAFFTQRSDFTRRRLRRLFSLGRTSLAIGVAFLAVMVVGGDLVANAMNEQRLGEILRESLLIGGWVAMWRPIEIFLYDWWPIRRDARLYDRLSAMPVRITYRGDDTKAEAWRWDWPVHDARKGARQQSPNSGSIPSVPKAGG